MPQIQPKLSFLTRVLNKIERAGNKLPHPFIIFIGLMVFAIILSAIFSSLNISASFEKIDQGVLTTQLVESKSLLSREGLLFMLSSVLTNFTSFFPLGTVFFMMLGVGIAEGSGLIRILLSHLVKVTPKYAITAVIVFLGIFSNIASPVGYVVLIPLAGLIFLGFNRHPIAGLSAAFAGVSGGWSANILIGATDAIFAGISTEAAKLIDVNYTVAATSNWYFMIVSTLLITVIGTWVTDKVVEPRLEPYHGESEPITQASSQDISALKWTGWALVLYIGIILLCVIPTGAILRNPVTGLLTGSPFMRSLIILIGFGFALCGSVFGFISGHLKSGNDIAEAMTRSIAQLSGFLVLIFFAAQFIAYFNYSNLGIILAIKGASALKFAGLTGIGLVIGLVILSAFLNLLIAIDSAKWAIMAPIFVPMFMILGLSPELTQAAVRVGDSVTNIIAPTMPFFPLFVAFCQKYNPKLGVGSVVAIMLPYSVLFLIGWSILLIAWIALGFDLGPGASLFYF
ncbi:aminobenzoyl-glutamate transport protein [Gammaproteobacteria bacterium]|nr:aminobenzoyl-glutamate transport protein [Gammaproteobacteria bacterium]